MELKARIAAGDTLLGTFIKTPHPHIIEVLATCGLDCLVLDAEHAPFDRRDLDQCLMAGRGSVPMIVRTPDASAETILNALDCGASGVLVPHVRSVDEARGVAAAAHYGSGRGYAGSTRAARYGLAAMTEHKRHSAAITTVIAQIEDAEGLDDIAAIAAVAGIDALFIGRIDLTISLGCDSPDDPVVVAACEHIVAACVAVGRPVGMFLSRVGDVPEWQARGVRLFLLGSDHGFLRSGAAAMRTAAGL